MQANRARLTVYPQYVFLSSFVPPFVGQFDFFPLADASCYPCTIFLTCCDISPSRAPLATTCLSCHGILYEKISPVLAFCDLSLLSVLALPIANHCFLFQSHPSHRYHQLPTGLCRSPRIHLTECLERFRDSIGQQLSCVRYQRCPLVSLFLSTPCE